MIHPSHHLFKVKNENIRTMSDICSRLTKIKPERRHSGVFIVTSEHILHIVLMFPLFTLNKKKPVGISL